MGHVLAVLGERDADLLYWWVDITQASRTGPTRHGLLLLGRKNRKMRTFWKTDSMDEGVLIARQLYGPTFSRAVVRDVWTCVLSDPGERRLGGSISNRQNGTDVGFAEGKDDVDHSYMPHGT